MIENGNNEEIDEAEEEINRQEALYHESVGKKWIIFAIGLLLGAIAGYFLMPSMLAVTKSSYDRSGIDSICKDMMGEVKVTDALTEEVAIIAYDYNAQEPRVFSKFTARQSEKLYDVSIAEASQASAAAPVYFDPKIIG